MPYSYQFYEAFKPFGENIARLMAEYIEELEKRKAVTSEEHQASILKLTLEMEKHKTELRVEMERIRADLIKEIEKLRTDTTKEIEKLRAEIYKFKVDLIKWLVALFISQLAAILGLFKWLFG